MTLTARMLHRIDRAAGALAYAVCVALGHHVSIVGEYCLRCGADLPDPRLTTEPTHPSQPRRRRYPR